MPKERKIFFKSEADRNLWIKLNAEVINYFQVTVNHKIDEGLGDINTPFSSMWVSRNQLDYDEHECDKPRFSLEELLTLSYDDLIKITRQQHKEWIQKHFPAPVDENDDEHL